MEDESSRFDSFVHHVGRATETFTILLFLCIRNRLTSLHSPEMSPRGRAPGSRYESISDHIHHPEDLLILAEIFLLFAAETDLALFHFRKPVDVRTRFLVLFIQRTAELFHMPVERATKVLSLRLETYANVIRQAGEALPNPEITDALLLFLIQSLGQGRTVYREFTPSYHDLALFKLAYNQRGFVFHAGLRHYLFRVMKTLDDFVFIDEPVFLDLLQESVDVARDMGEE